MTIRYRVKYRAHDGTIVKRIVETKIRADDMPQTIRMLSDRDENNQQTLFTFTKKGRAKDDVGPFLLYEES